MVPHTRRACGMEASTGAVCARPQRPRETHLNLAAVAGARPGELGLIQADHIAWALCALAPPRGEQKHVPVLQVELVAVRRLGEQATGGLLAHDVALQGLQQRPRGLRELRHVVGEQFQQLAVLRRGLWTGRVGGGGGEIHSVAACGRDRRVLRGDRRRRLRAEASRSLQRNRCSRCVLLACAAGMLDRQLGGGQVNDAGPRYFTESSTRAHELKSNAMLPQNSLFLGPPHAMTPRHSI